MATQGFDTSQLRSFEADLRRAPAAVTRAVPPIVSRGALNVKNRIRDDLAGSRHFKGISRSVNYDLLDAGTAAEIGPDKALGGALGNVAFFGTSRGGGTVPDPRLALEAEIPNLELWLGRAAQEAL
jgi:hypothetical protein